MKYKLTLIACFVALTIVGKGQTNEKPESTDNKKVIVVVQSSMGVPAVTQLFTRYLAMHIDTSLLSLKAADAHIFSVAASYTINKDGKVTDEVAETHPGYGAAEEVIRVMKKYPERLQVLQNGKPIEFHGKLKVLFTVLDNHSTYGKPESETYEKVFTAVQIEAEFPGGPQAWKRFLERNLNVNVPGDKGAPAGRYTVIVSFLVDKNGNISDITADNNPGYGTVEETTRVIKNGPPWKPAVQNGHNVAYRARQAITFMVSKDK